MSSSLDLSLDDIIRKNRRLGGHKRNFHGKFSSTGPHRRPPSRDLIRATPYPVPRQLEQQQQQRQQQTMPSGGISTETETKLYVSNLDYGVTDDDIMVLFSEVGKLKKYSINYDISGRSKGTAEVVFHRHSDALAAIKRYNNVHLDGKPIKIELVGLNLVAPYAVAPSKSRILQNSNGGFRSGVGAEEWDRGSGRVSASGRTQGNRHGKQLTAEDLDADLDRYRLAATTTRIKNIK